MKPLAPVVLVMGKGGVGKTTVAAGLAVLEAETHGHSVLVEVGDGESGRRALWGGHKEVEHVVIKPDEAITRGATPLFGSATLARLCLGNFAMKPLLRAAPAVRELAMLESVRQVKEAHPGARVVVDMPATGHGVAWLRIPRQGKTLLGSGPLFEMCDRLSRELLAPGHASIAVVTLPERLVLEETFELCAAIEAGAGLGVDRLVVNRLPVAMPEGALEEAAALAGQATAAGRSASEILPILRARAAARAESLSALDHALRAEHAVWRLPLAPVDPSAKDVARWLLNEGAP